MAGCPRLLTSTCTGSLSSVTRDHPQLHSGEILPDYANSCATSQNYKFTGKERDAESGLDDFGARYYSSNFGRFVSADWAANATAVPYANYGNPQSLNLYSYVRNNPTTTTDPDGHCAEDACIGETAVVAITAGYIFTAATIQYYRQNPDAEAALSAGANAARQTVSNVINKSAAQLRKEWEKINGKKWPTYPDSGKNYDAHHAKPKADEGADSGENIQPMPHDAHVEHHKKNGDFKRWGKRAHAKPPNSPKPEPPKPDPPKPPNA